jgi:probable F420-dependent oxidoreductase
MTAFLDGLDSAATPVPVASRILAALGPKMLALAGQRSGGVHPYLVTPEHTHQVRELLGAGPLVLPEQTAVLCRTRDEARVAGTEWFRQYLGLPNYANNLLRLGFTEADIADVSDRLFDAVIVWGDEDTIAKRLDEHRAAGADHVCIQVLSADPMRVPREEWRRLSVILH